MGSDSCGLVLDKPLPVDEHARIDAAVVQVSPTGATGKIRGFEVDKCGDGKSDTPWRHLTNGESGSG